MTFHSAVCYSFLPLPNNFEWLIVFACVWNFGAVTALEKHIEPINVLDKSGQPLQRLFLCDTWLDSPNAQDESPGLCSRCAAGYGFPCDCREKICDNCVRKNQVCDGTVDCADGSDETDCGNSSCAADRRKCRSLQTGSSVCPKPCTGEDHFCADLEDQFNCETQCSADDLFLCDNTRCIRRKYWCDGENDCGDWSDEDGCASNSSETFFNCITSDRAISASLLCNGISNCADHSDEISPAARCEQDHVWYCLPQNIATKQYKANSQRINASMICNGFVDCENSADEENCVQFPTETTTNDERDEFWTITYNETILFLQQSTVKTVPRNALELGQILVHEQVFVIATTVLSLVVLFAAFGIFVFARIKRYKSTRPNSI